MKEKGKNIVLESTGHATKDAKLFLEGKEISQDVEVVRITANAKEGVIRADLKLVPEKVRVKIKALVAFETAEPRYSEKELFKVKDWMYGNEKNYPESCKHNDMWEGMIVFFEILKDKKRVQEILNG